MKKFTRTMALALVTAMLLSMTAFAAPKVNPEGEHEVEAVVDAGGQKLTSLTYADADIANEGQYMIFVVDKDEDGDYFPTASSILYINQKQAAAEDTITFENIFPKEMKNSGIMISGNGFDLPTLIAKILAMLKGDVDKNGEVNVLDAVKILRFVVEATDLDSEAMDVGNVDGQGSAPDVLDAIKILRYVIGAVEEL